MMKAAVHGRRLAVHGRRLAVHGRRLAVHGRWCTHVKPGTCRLYCVSTAAPSNNPPWCSPASMLPSTAPAQRANVDTAPASPAACSSTVVVPPMPAVGAGAVYRPELNSALLRLRAEVINVPSLLTLTLPPASSACSTTPVLRCRAPRADHAWSASCPVKGYRMSGQAICSAVNTCNNVTCQVKRAIGRMSGAKAMHAWQS